jgi:hypothetical protein
LRLAKARRRAASLEAVLKVGLKVEAEAVILLQSLVDVGVGQHFRDGRDAQCRLS